MTVFAPRQDALEACQKVDPSAKDRKGNNMDCPECAAASAPPFLDHFPIQSLRFQGIPPYFPTIFDDFPIKIFIFDGHVPATFDPTSAPPGPPAIRASPLIRQTCWGDLKSLG